MTKIKCDSSLTLNEYLEKYLPSDYNEQDKTYLTERYKWETIKNYSYENVSKAYKGTTFQKRYS